jgi:hypothetical protein
MRRIWSVLNETKAGGGGAAEALQESRDDADLNLKSFRAIDYRDSCLGIVLLALSFAMGTFAEVVKLLGSTSPH